MASISERVFAQKEFLRKVFDHAGRSRRCGSVGDGGFTDSRNSLVGQDVRQHGPASTDLDEVDSRFGHLEPLGRFGRGCGRCR